MFWKRLWADIHRLALSKPPARVDRPVVVAAIPLIAKSKAGDWDTVCHNLARTVRSVLAQDYDNVEVLICGQDRPDHLAASDRVRFIEAPTIATRKKTDKGEKIALMTDDLARRHKALTYVMILDADDLLHPRLFLHAATDNNSRGYLIDKGYMIDLETRDLAPLSPENGHSFDRHCGSCALFAADFARPWVAKRYLKTLSRSHNRYAELTERFGLPLDPVPFFAALYVLNHGENARARRGVGGHKAQRLIETRIQDRDRVTSIQKEFGLDRIL